MTINNVNTYMTDAYNIVFGMSVSSTFDTTYLDIFDKVALLHNKYHKWSQS